MNSERPKYSDEMRNEDEGVILAVDYGIMYVGLAVSDVQRRVAVGAGRLEGLGGRALGRAVFAAAKQRGATTVVVGSPPVGAKNVEPVIAGADKLSAVLEKKGLIVERWDESYTTAAALSAKRYYGGKSRKKGKQWIDEAAAILILQSFLENRSQSKNNSSSSGV